MNSIFCCNDNTLEIMAYNNRCDDKSLVERIPLLIFKYLIVIHKNCSTLLALLRLSSFSSHIIVCIGLINAYFLSDNRYIITLNFK